MSCRHYRFVLKGKVKPYVRMTQRGKFVRPEARAYLASKEALAWQFKAQMMGKVRFERTPLAVLIKFNEARRFHHKDLSNEYKAVEDAANGIVWDDDCWVDLCIARRKYEPEGEWKTKVHVFPLREYIEYFDFWLDEYE